MSMRTEHKPVILVGDDDRGCRGALRRLFAGAGFEVVQAESIARLEHAIRGQSDLMVVEYMFPDGPVAPLLKRLKQDSPFTGVVVLTGTADVEAAADVLSQGVADRFLTKPWDDDWLLDVVQGVLTEKRLLRENRELVDRLQQANARLEEMVSLRTSQLEQAKRQWEMTFDAIDEPLFILDHKNMTILRANRATARLLGMDIRDVPGEKCHVLLMGTPHACEGCPAVLNLATGRRRITVKGHEFEAVFFRAQQQNVPYVVHLREDHA